MTDGTHEAAVARLREAYAAVPPGTPVRLAERTSNLLGSRARCGRPGGGSTSRPSTGGSSRSTPGARTADVQGMTTYEHLVDATLPPA